MAWPKSDEELKPILEEIRAVSNGNESSDCDKAFEAWVKINHPNWRYILLEESKHVWQNCWSTKGNGDYQNGLKKAAEIVRNLCDGSCGSRGLCKYIEAAKAIEDEAQIS